MDPTKRARLAASSRYRFSSRTQYQPPDPPERREQMRRQRRRENRQGLLRAFSCDPLREPPPRLRRIRHPVTAIPKRVIHGLPRIRLKHARHHVVTYIDPAPPRIVDIDAP